ncbi:hypothetical protein TSOC_010907, partial [Tetrabaena socialis]
MLHQMQMPGLSRRHRPVFPSSQRGAGLARPRFSSGVCRGSPASDLSNYVIESVHFGDDTVLECPDLRDKLAVRRSPFVAHNNFGGGFGTQGARCRLEEGKRQRRTVSGCAPPPPTPHTCLLVRGAVVLGHMASAAEHASPPLNGLPPTLF